MMKYADQHLHFFYLCGSLCSLVLSDYNVCGVLKLQLMGHSGAVWHFFILYLKMAEQDVSPASCFYVKLNRFPLSLSFKLILGEAEVMPSVRVNCKYCSLNTKKTHRVHPFLLYMLQTSKNVQKCQTD